MTVLPSISAALDQKKITKIINKKFSILAPSFYKFISTWFINSYSNFKDIETYIILIYLVNNDFEFYQKNGITIDYETFYKDKTLEIENIKIIQIAKDLQIPKESVRRKIATLEKKGVIKRKNKKIFIDRNAYQTVQPVITIKNLSNLISIATVILKSEKKIESISSSEEVIALIKKKFTFCWFQFYKFIFLYYLRIKNEVDDLETFCIGILIMYNAVSNKEFILQNINVFKWRNEINTADTVGLNAMSIADITGIPRPTVVRKLNILIKKGWIETNDQKLVFFKIDQLKFSKAKKMHYQTIQDMSELIFKILNQISINLTFLKYK